MIAAGILSGCGQQETPEQQNGDSNDKPREEELSSSLIQNPASARAGSENKEEKGQLPRFRFRKEEHDFGAIDQGEKLSYTFSFVNKGEAPLLINEATASCGCTVPRYPRKPIAPGEKGEIEVIFDSSGKTGNFRKTVTLKANTSPTITKLYITGNIQTQ